jgi:hypothetical protein
MQPDLAEVTRHVKTSDGLTVRARPWLSPASADPEADVTTSAPPVRFSAREMALYNAICSPDDLVQAIVIADFLGDERKMHILTAALYWCESHRRLSLHSPDAANRMPHAACRMPRQWCPTRGEYFAVRS